MNNTTVPNGMIAKRNYKKILIPVIAVILLLTVLKNCGSTSLPDSSEGIKANVWYTYKEVDVLKVQNCVVCSAVLSSGNKVMVQYIPVCRGCHEPAQMSDLCYVSPKYSKIDDYICSKCEVRTVVKLKVKV